jgi:hypothetical protein
VAFPYPRLQYDPTVNNTLIRHREEQRDAANSRQSILNQQIAAPRSQ